MWIYLLILLLTVALLAYWKKINYWNWKGVPGPIPLPFVGNVAASLFGRKTVFEIYADIYKKYPDCPVIGIFRTGDPCLLLKDPDIIKDILIKDFNYFVNNDVFVDKNCDPMFARNLFFLKDQEWKQVRQFLSPSFAPAKIKMLFPLVDKAGKNFVEYLEKHQGDVLDLKGLCSRYTSDVVADCAFGLEGHSFKDPKSYFFQLISLFVSADSFQSFKMAMSFFLPNLLSLKILPKSFDDGIMKITEDMLKYRKENDFQRSDILDAISKFPGGSILEIAGHLTGFLTDAYETTSGAMSFMFYELAINQECQRKLREEINTVLEKSNGELSPDILKDMIYLECCIFEALRKHPPLAQLSKTCNKTYTISHSTGNRTLNITIEKGSVVIVPLLGLHMDPKYFQQPDKFMPERFMDQDTSAYKHVYYPFGSGLRGCLGRPLAMLMAKAGIANVIRNFEIKLDNKTKPLKYNPFYFLLNYKGGAWISCKKISNRNDKK